MAKFKSEKVDTNKAFELMGGGRKKKDCERLFRGYNNNISVNSIEQKMIKGIRVKESKIF